MADYDGKVEIPVGFDTDDIKNDVEKMRKELESLRMNGQTKGADKFSEAIRKALRQATDLKNQIDQLKTAMTQPSEKAAQYREQLAETVDKASELRTRLEELRTVETPAPEYEKLRKKLEDVENEEARAEAALLRMTDAERDSEIGVKLAKQMDAASIKAEALRAQLDAMRGAGEDVRIGGDPKEIAKLEAEYAKLTAKANELREKISGANDKQREMTRGKLESLQSRYDAVIEKIALLRNKQQQANEEFQKTSGAQGAINSLATAFSKGFVPATNKATSTLKKFGATILGITLNPLTGALKRLVPQLGKTNKGFKLNLTTILKYALGIRGLYALFNKLRRAMTDGFKNLAQFRDGNNRVNESLSLLMSSLTQLKNSFATAFAPILTAVAPALNYLIQMINSAVTALGMLFAYLSGSHTFIRAKQIQQNYAKSLDKTAGAADKAYKKLAPFDDLQILGDDDTSGGGAGSGEIPIEDMFEEVELGDFQLPDPFELAKKFAEWLKNLLKSIPWDIIQDWAAKLGQWIAKFLNGIFSDLDLAHEIGYAIAQMLNTALIFAYNFIKTLDWMQMGRWFGELIKTGIETFDWELLGETVGLFLNGIADAILGFFEIYPAGLLGTKLSEFFNKAIQTIDESKLATAFATVVSAAALEIYAFFTGSDFKLLGEKLGNFIKTAFTYTKDDKTIGQIVGETLAAVINAGIDLLLGADISHAIAAIADYFSDMLVAAITNVRWQDLLKALANLVMGMVTGLIKFVMDAIGGVLDNVIPGMAETTRALTDEIVDNLGDVDSIIKTITGESVFVVDAFTAMEDATRKIGDGTKYTYDELLKLQQLYGLTDQDIEQLIIEMDAFNEANTGIANALDLASLGLEGYNGDWNEFRSNVGETASAVRDATASMSQDLSTTNKAIGTYADEVDASVETVKNGAKTMAADVKEATEKTTEYVKINTQNLNESTKNTGDYKESAVKALDEVSVKAEETSATFEEMDFNVQSTLDEVTQQIDEWFNATMETYFSYDVWIVFGETLMTVMEEVLATFFEYWTEQFDLWVENNETYFGLEAWNAQWMNLHNSYLTVWQLFYSTWQANMKLWWEKFVKPYFTMEQWKLFGNNMKTGILAGFREIVNELGGICNKVIDIFNQACNNVKDAMNDMINEFNRVAGRLGVDTLPTVSFHNISRLKIPALASGAVIPPNREFLAVLGDQTRGTNIEAPLETIVDAFRQAMGEWEVQMTGASTMELDGETFARVLTPYVMSELNRQGYNVSILEA